MSGKSDAAEKPQQVNPVIIQLANRIGDLEIARALTITQLNAANAEIQRLMAEIAARDAVAEAERATKNSSKTKNGNA